MILDQFWLTDAQVAKIAPHLGADRRGKARVDDRRVISGMIPVFKSGGRWIDAPPEYGPKKTLSNRYARRAAKGIWVDPLHALARAGGPPAQPLIDSSAVKAHRAASGGKGEEKSGHQPLVPRATRYDRNPANFLAVVASPQPSANGYEVTTGRHKICRHSTSSCDRGPKRVSLNSRSKNISSERGSSRPAAPEQSARADIL